MIEWFPDASEKEEFNYIFTSLIRGHHRLHVLRGKCQLVAEEKRPNKGELFKFFQGDWFLQKLPLGLEREEFVDELLGVRQEIVIIIFIPELG